MPLDISAAESAHSRGTVSFSEWKRNFETRWFLPIGLTMLSTMMGAMQPQDLMNQRPEAMSNVYDVMKRLRGG